MQNREQEVQKVIDGIVNLVYQYTDLEEYQRQKLETILLQEGYEELCNVSITLAECHVIDCIGRNELLNTTAIAKKLHITKGGISKITAKLIKKNMIEVYRLANNQKERYFRLKPLGQKVFELHDVLHKQAEDAFKTYFNTYSQEELVFACKFLADVTAAMRARKAGMLNAEKQISFEGPSI